MLAEVVIIIILDLFAAAASQQLKAKAVVHQLNFSDSAGIVVAPTLSAIHVFCVEPIPLTPATVWTEVQVRKLQVRSLILFSLFFPLISF